MAIQLELLRDFADDSATVGVVSAPNGRRWQYIEPPWVPVDGAPCGQENVSCVPAGLYRLVAHNTEAHPNVWALVNPDLWIYHEPGDVPADREALARVATLIHSANRPWELKGCGAPGKSRGKDSSGWYVADSRDALNEIRGVLNGSYDLWLNIAYATGVGPGA